MSAIFLAFFVAVCLAFCWYHWKKTRRYSAFPSQRMDPVLLLRVLTGRYRKGFTLTQLVFQELLKTANSFLEKGLYVSWFFQPRILVFNENLVKHLISDPDLSDKGGFYDANTLLFGNGLLTSKHDVWKVHRKLLNPAFSVSMLKSSLPSLNKYASQLCEKIGTCADEPIENVSDILKWSSLQSMFDYVLGMKPENEKLQDVSEKAKEIVDVAAGLLIEKAIRPWLHFDILLPLFELGRKYLKLNDDINYIMNEIMEELKKEHFREESQEVMSCGRILTKLYLQDHIFTEKDVLDHLTSLTAAGSETVAVAMIWCLYTLGHHPQAQERAYNEVMSIVPERDITYEDLAEMKYLECVIKETMRLYSVIPFITKNANRDIECGQYTIPKGTDVLIFPFVLHRDPNVFPEPGKFDPDRFSDSSRLRPWMYIPFAEGYRSCIGKKFAMIELKIQLAHLLRRFKITSLNRIEDSDLECVIFLKSTVNQRLLFENRH